MRWNRPLLRLPAYAINGICVGLGIGLVHALAAACFGEAFGVAAMSGAVYASLADLPNLPRRTGPRVLAAAVLGWLVSLLFSVLRPYPEWVGLALALTGFFTAMGLAWGLRAGPFAFVGVLAFVFTMATPEAADGSSFWPHLAGVGFGGLAYAAWAWLSSTALQPRFRELALADVLKLQARMLRLRANWLRHPRDPGTAPADTVAAWLDHEVRLAERLQRARDLLYGVPAAGHVAAQGSLLMQAIDLNDMLLTADLDVERLGPGGDAARAEMAGRLDVLSQELDALVRTLLSHAPLPAGGLHSDGSPQEPTYPAQAGDAGVQQRVAEVLRVRAADMAACLARMRAAAAGQATAPDVPLQAFVSNDDWSLKTLWQHRSGRSPVLRHAVRLALAMAVAYYVALLLPRATHPYWLVLSVAVVLRGNLEQTLSRRNARIAGTVIGCLAAWAVVQWMPTVGLAVVFLVAVGTAHAFVNERYLLTASAGTVMALVQSHLAAPEAHLAVGERLVDTVLGALLAWAFSYVLPAWERRSVPRLAQRAAGGLARLARRALRWPSGVDADVAQRLARRDVFAALGELAVAARRTAVEPQQVRVPLAALVQVLWRGQVLLAHLLAARLLLTRRSGQLQRDVAEQWLASAAAGIAAVLEAVATGVPRPPAPALPTAGQDGLAPFMPWLERRLLLTRVAAEELADAVQALRDATR